MTQPSIDQRFDTKTVLAAGSIPAPRRSSAVPRLVSVAPGDGIGPEITEATVRVLEAARAPFEYRLVSVGANARRGGAETGIAPDTWDTLRQAGVLLKGPTRQFRGAPAVDTMLRRHLGLFASVRPARSYAPTVRTLHPALDVVVISECEEGLQGAAQHRQSHEVIQNVEIVSRPGCERIVRYAFQYARGRKRKRLTCMTREDVRSLTEALFREIFIEVAAQYPDVEAEHMSAKRGIAELCVNPECFDVIVTGNLHGDLLSEVATELTGSTHMAPAASIGEAYSLFEARHGTAEDIAGKNLANPSGLILAGVKMLAHLGQGEIAEQIHNAWLCTVEDGVHTADIHRQRVSRRRAGTQAFANAVIARLGDTPRRLVRATYPRLPTLIPAPSRRRCASRVMVGVDVFVRFNGEVETLAKMLSATRVAELCLESISNRGITVWPGGHPMTLCTDHWRCRFMASRRELQVDNESVVALLSHLRSLGMDFLKTEHLYCFDGEPGFAPT